MEQEEKKPTMERITVTIEPELKKKIEEQQEKENRRSFSEMVCVLIDRGLTNKETKDESSE